MVVRERKISFSRETSRNKDGRHRWLRPHQCRVMESDDGVDTGGSCESSGMKVGSCDVVFSTSATLVVFSLVIYVD